MLRMRFLFLPLLLLPLTVQAQSCNYACQAGRAEAQFLQPGLAERRDDRLILATDSGTLIFRNNRKACDSGGAACAVYVLAERAPNSLVVRKFEFEGSDCYLIDTRTGKSTLLTGVPVFSPDGHEFLVTEFSNDSDNNREMWRRVGDGAKLEWAHPFKQAYAEDRQLREIYEARVAAWSGDHIALALNSSDRKQHWTGSLERDATGWHLVAKSPPGLLPRQKWSPILTRQQRPDTDSQYKFYEVMDEWRKPAREPWRILFPDLEWAPPDVPEWRCQGLSRF